MKALIKRAFVILPAVLLEAAIVLLLFMFLDHWAVFIEAAFRIIGLLCILFVVSYRSEGAYKVLWLLFFAAFPIPAALAYLLWGNKRTVQPIIGKIEQAQKELLEGAASDNTPNPENAEGQNSGDKAAQQAQLVTELRKSQPELYDKRIGESLAYVSKLTGSSLRPASGTEYYPLGEDCWQAMLEEMKTAEKYIYLEYFIVEDGLMWQAMTDIMAEKVKEGVDVRLIYDDMGSLATFTRKDRKKLDSIGVKWIAFNQLKFITGTLNNRSHRKMLIIDGRTAFSGGINLADEYINRRERFGHWKDIGFRITGPAVDNFLYMFVSFWNACSPDKVPRDIFDADFKAAEKTDGMVLSYYDSPGYRDPVSNNFFIEMLGNSSEYAWFYTPYLMLGDTLLDAFVRAAERGVDVRIITPGIPDKKLVFRMTRSFYLPLLRAGVRIFEYTPGFVHAKASLYDGGVCTIGTVNLDYRSLYLHFENNSIFWNSSIHEKLQADYLETQSKCREITLENMKRNIFGILLDGILRIFSPLC